jgi:hypothetical protein
VFVFLWKFEVEKWNKGNAKGETDAVATGTMEARGE